MRTRILLLIASLTFALAAFAGASQQVLIALGSSSSPVVLTGTFASPLYDGVSYSQSIAISGGNGSYTSPSTASGSLPSGLSLSVSGSNLVLSGTCNSGTTSTFTVSVQDTASHSGTSSSQSLTRQDQNFSSVTSLVHFDSNTGGVYPDVKGHTYNSFSGFGLTTTAPIFGAGSGLANSIGWTETAASTDFNFGTGDYTIEMWIHFSAFASGGTIVFDFRPASTNGLYPSTSVSAAGAPNFFMNGGSILITGSNGTIVTGSNYHVAVSRVSGTTRLFVNGTQAGSNLSDTNSYSTGNPIIGDNAFHGNNTLPNLSTVDEFRVTKGVGRYSANFTAPIDAFPDSGLLPEWVLRNHFRAANDDTLSIAA